MKKILSLLGGLLLAAQSSQAWVIKPVWENFVQTNTVSGSNFVYYTLPILSNTWNNLSKTNSRYDGADTLPVLGSLKRYDSTRMLLAITENGIVENADLITTNFPLYQLATNYPDRSLIWINPTNGNPMGLALTIGTRPVSPSQWYTNFQYTTTSNNPTGTNQKDGPNGVGTTVGTPIYTNLLVNFQFDFDSSADGFVYTGYKNKLLRYRPDGSGGFLPTPEVVTEMGVTARTNSALVVTPPRRNWDTNGIGFGGSDNRRWNTTAGLFGCITVRGSGSNTVIMAGGRGTINQQLYVWYFDTQDATNFFATANFGAGAWAGPIKPPTGYNYTNLTGEMWNYQTQYPTANYGANVDVPTTWAAFPYGCGAPMTNLVTAAQQYGFGGVVSRRNFTNYSNNGIPAVGTNIGANIIQRNNTFGGSTPAKYYQGRQIGGMQALEGCPFFVAAALPQNNIGFFLADGFPNYYKPGWLALHEVVGGNRLAVWELGLRETDIILPNDTSATFQAIYSGIGLYTNNTALDQPTGSYEITWGNYAYGYGRYIVEPDNMNITNIVFAAGNSTVDYTVNTSTNNDYVLQKTTSLAGTPAWTDVTTGVPFPGPYNTAGTPLVDSSATDTNAFYRLRLRVP